MKFVSLARLNQAVYHEYALPSLFLSDRGRNRVLVSYTTLAGVVLTHANAHTAARCSGERAVDSTHSSTNLPLELNEPCSKRRSQQLSSARCALTPQQHASRRNNSNKTKNAQARLLLPQSY